MFCEECLYVTMFCSSSVQCFKENPVSFVKASRENGDGVRWHPIALGLSVFNPCHILTCWLSIHLPASPAKKVSAHTHCVCLSVGGFILGQRYLHGTIYSQNRLSLHCLPLSACLHVFLSPKWLITGEYRVWTHVFALLILMHSQAKNDSIW